MDMQRVRIDEVHDLLRIKMQSVTERDSFLRVVPAPLLEDEVLVVRWDKDLWTLEIGVVKRELAPKDKGQVADLKNPDKGPDPIPPAIVAAVKKLGKQQLEEKAALEGVKVIDDAGKRIRVDLVQQAVARAIYQRQQAAKANPVLQAPPAPAAAT